MKCNWRIVSSCVTLALTLAVSSHALAGGGADLIPDKAGLAVVVGSLDRLAADVAKFGTAIGVDQIAGVTAKDICEEMLEVSDGVDTAGSFAMALIPGEEPTPVLIVPVKDVEAWKKAASAEAVEGGAGLVKLLLHGEDYFAAVKDQNVVLSTSKDVLGDALKSKGEFAKKLAKAAGESAKSDDLVVFVDVQVWKDTIEGGLMQAEGLMQMGLAMQPNGAQTAEMFKAMMGELRGLIKDSSVLCVGVKAGGDGVHVTKTFGFLPESKTASYLKNVKKAKGGVLRGLPDQPFLAAGGLDWESDGSSTMMKAMFEMAFKSGDLEEKLGAEKIADLKKCAEQLTKIVSGYNMAMLPGPDSAGFVLCGSYLTKDPKTTMDLVSKMTEAQGAMFGSMGAGGVEVAASSEKIGGADAKSFAFTFKMDDPQQAAVIKALYGEKPTLFLAPAKDGVAYALGDAAAAKETAGKLVEGKGAPLAGAKMTKSSFGSLPADPQFALMFDVVKIAEFGMKIAATMGAGAPPVNFPKNPLPYVTVSAYLNAAEVQTHLLVPAEAIKAIVAAASGTATEPQ
ncbi:MAG: hypothetical protein CHACPFDD_03663 [Phycisphaerae bacterium]|nr:hypothetical protein [Phycisphaerae bacterium]